MRNAAPPTTDEVMTIVAARALRDNTLCLVGIGIPSEASNLARRLHAPGLVLIYESGTIGSKPDVLPLSIGDGELAETADTVVPVAEIFAFWLQAGRIDTGFLGAAQIDRFGNLNTTVIGSYEAPRVRLPGAGGAPEIAAHAREVIIVMRHGNRAFVETLDFVTSAGFLDGGSARERAGLRGKGPTRVITDLGILEPDPATRELVLTRVHPGIEVDTVRRATGWPLTIADPVGITEPVTALELATLRELRQRTTLAPGASESRTRSRIQD
jgi:glutaconate CoA-transferase subunit B